MSHLKDELKKLSRDLRAWLKDQDENLIYTSAVPSDNAPANIDSVEDLMAETEKNEAMAAAEHLFFQAAAEKKFEPQKKISLESLKEQVIACRDCPLGISRLNPVFGIGSSKAKLMFVGEGPGFQEDHQGEPFVGRSGQLLDKIMENVLSLRRSDVYIANIVKCHPMKNPETPEAHSNDRPPAPDEIEKCRHYLEEQIRIIQPVCIVPLGSVAAKFLLKTNKGISFLRGHVYDYESDIPGLRHTIKVIPTYHPAALLRNQNLKRDTWHDILLVKDLLDSASQ